jgi:hypothetical protein
MGAGLGEHFVGDGVQVIADHRLVLSTDSEHLLVGCRLPEHRHVAPVRLVLGERLPNRVERLLLAEDRAM